jgi:predicted nucleic acid-binding protein
MEILGYRFDSKDEEQIIKKFLTYLTIIYIDKDIADNVIEIKQKNKIKLPDAIICATAIRNNAVLITNDVRLNTVSDLDIKILGLSSQP